MYNTTINNIEWIANIAMIIMFVSAGIMVLGTKFTKDPLEIIQYDVRAILCLTVALCIYNIFM